MRVIKPNFLKKLAIGIGFLIVLFFIINWMAHSRVKSLLEESLTSHMQLTYEDLNISSLSRSLTIENISLSLNDSITQDITGKITIEKLELNRFGLLDYLFNETLVLDHVGISNVGGYLKLQNSINKDRINIIENLPISKANIDEFLLEHVSFELRSIKTDSVLGSIDNLNIKAEAIKGVFKTSIPTLSCKSYDIKTDSIRFAIDPFNTINAKSISGTDEEIIITAPTLKTKFKPMAFSSYLNYEKNYYDIKIAKIKSMHLPKTIQFNQSLLTIGSILVEQPDVFIYRDKLVDDDLRIKPMLSAMLRNVPVPYYIENFQINEAQLIYKERLEENANEATLSFKDSNIIINNLSNKAEYQPITIEVNTRLAGSAKVNAQWTFDILDKTDAFIFKADANAVDLSSLDSYSRPHFNAEMEGEINKLYFTISGNNKTSKIDVKSRHSNVKVTVYKKHKSGRKKLISSVANLMISKDSKNKKSDYKSTQTKVERDITKSAFNFILKNIQKGMVKIFL